MDSILLTCAVCLALAISGFVAVLVYRLPIILQQIQQEKITPEDKKKIGYIFLLWPSSHCPACRHSLRFFEKIPLFSYLFLKGRCAYCREKIHNRYFLIEATSVISSAIIIYTFDWTLQALAALFLSWGLVALSSIDLECGVLPDILVLPLLWLGLSLNAFNTFVSTASAVLGALVAYLSLWMLASLYRLFTKKEGMGYGDFKLFAVFGAWLGLNSLAPILFFASLFGLLISTTLIFLKKLTFNTAIPFGPFLALSGWIFLLYEHSHGI